VFELLNEQRVQTAAKIGSSDVTLQADVSSNSIVRFVVPAWDSLPGFLKASGWGSIKRIMVFELKLEGEYANGYLYLGPAPAEVRQPYLDILNAHRYKPDQAAGTKWTCIAKQEIYGPASDNIDVDAAAQEVVAALREFCRSEVNRITPLLKQVVVPPRRCNLHSRWSGTAEGGRGTARWPHEAFSYVFVTSDCFSLHPEQISFLKIKSDRRADLLLTNQLLDLGAF
jgi:hypothetical protein